ncbi:unnamed protein product [Eruca vesicaria subsp. sativa]|uniref:60S ribosomal protein L7a n=1 Tax=Eruca vesicaria subsp. sativa TaxID=29727 RepID=A0ABC8J8L3_ERUVS|nr:unnamed protein product [Eruca vesicaria subsp. sativa]
MCLLLSASVLRCNIFLASRESNKPTFQVSSTEVWNWRTLPPKKDLTRYIKWPKSIRLQRQKRILRQRLKVPPALNKFTKTVQNNLASSISFPFVALNYPFILLKYRPEDKAAKKKLLLKKVQSEAEGKPVESKKPIVAEYVLSILHASLSRSLAVLNGELFTYHNSSVFSNCIK